MKISSILQVSVGDMSKIYNLNTRKDAGLKIKRDGKEQLNEIGSIENTWRYGDPE